ncbi:MAG: hypothetical protein HUJ86_01540 [Synergistes sp.]|nr:hypothetical protein [Synergistes sp.]
MKMRIIAAFLTLILVSSPITAYAADANTPVSAPAANTAPANTAAETSPTTTTTSGQTGGTSTTSPVPATVSTGNDNTIVKPLDSDPAFQMLDKIEIIVFGNQRSGGLVGRLDEVEKTVFGRELPGSLTERQAALLDFLEKGSGGQPSLLFKMSVAEWATEQQNHPTWALTRRVDTLEGVLTGVIQNGPLVSRIEKLLMQLLPDGVTATSVEIPKQTIVKAVLRDTLTVRNVKVNDIIILGLNEQIVVNNVLVAPKGSRVFAHITQVKPPRSFGRSSVIEMQLDSVEVLTPAVVPVNLGEAAKKAMEIDSATLGAIGASFGGALILGPLGLAGGFLIRGNDKQLKEGTLFYVETTDNATATGYAIPQQINPMISPTEFDTPQGTKSLPEN